MDFNSFKKTVQTFGSCRDRWETNDPASADILAKTEEGKAIVHTEKTLDDKLDTFCPPVCIDLTDRLYTVIINEKTQRQFFLFVRYSAWLSLLFMIGGFCLGWYQTQQDYINTQSYFDTIFDPTFDINY